MRTRKLSDWAENGGFWIFPVFLVLNFRLGSLGRRECDILYLQVWCGFTACEADVLAIVSFFDFCICVGILELCILMLVEDLSEVGKSLAGGLYGPCLMCWRWNLCGLL